MFVLKEFFDIMHFLVLVIISVNKQSLMCVGIITMMIFLMLALALSGGLFLGTILYSCLHTSSDED